MGQMIVGNWKMHGHLAEARARVEAIVSGQESGVRSQEVVLCPPYTLLAPVSEWLKGYAIQLGAQDCSPHPHGAYTGDVSAEMLRDAGCRHVIVGHSERRHGHGETDALVQAKVSAAHRAGLTAIVCIGETLDEQGRGETEAVLKRQLAGSLPASVTPENTAIAYEPVWAIGSGKTPTVEDIARIHRFILSQLSANTPYRVLYGGSVKAANASDILHTPGVGGALVGGASLDAKEFCAIAGAAQFSSPF